MRRVRPFTNGHRIKSPQDVLTEFQALSVMPKEQVWMLITDGRGRQLLQAAKLGDGNHHTCHYDRHLMAKLILAVGHASRRGDMRVIVVHNHPNTGKTRGWASRSDVDAAWFDWGWVRQLPGVSAMRNYVVSGHQIWDHTDLSDQPKGSVEYLLQDTDSKAERKGRGKRVPGSGVLECE